MSLIIVQRMKPCSVRLCGPLLGSSETKHGELPDKEITRRPISIWSQSVLQGCGLDPEIPSFRAR